jgi:DNA phosphorothioation system restriction enzyme
LPILRPRIKVSSENRPKETENVSLRQLPLQLSYRTGRGDMVKGFFVPCLEHSTMYRRAAGYFTSFGLGLAARGVASLASRNGIMRLVASPHLEPGDVEALRTAVDRPADVLRGIVSRSMTDIEDALLKDRLNALAWLAASGCLEIRLALRLDDEGKIARGIFHEKTGIFSDEAGDHIAFSGSSNETAGGLVENFESIDVFRSWKDPDGRVAQKIADFDGLWENTTPGLEVIEFTAAGRDLLEYFRDPSRPPPGFSRSVIRDEPDRSRFEPPPGFDLRIYQGDAIRAWSRAGGRGILAMATGAGKTLTALVLASKVAAKNSPLVLIVVCPFINLCNQWLREMAAFGLRPVSCYEGRQRWETQLEEGYQRLSAGLLKVHAIVTTNATFQSDSFQARIRSRVGSFHHLLIADECHNLGAESIQKTLPDEIQLRLGLSATPERHHDPIGTQGIVDYFGGVVFEFSLARAIADGRLCPYRYYPHLVTLTDEETDEYAEITAKLGKMMGGKDKDEEIGQAAMRLLIRRSRLLASAQNKLAVLDQVIGSLPERPKKALFYCGDGRTTDTIADEEVRQIQAVSRLLGDKHGLKVRNFTFREKTDEREEILRDAASGFLDGIVAIRCLDEGIDVPDLRMGFLLASSTNPRQFVQRRGRLLRHAPGKKRAIIHDFIIQPPDFGGTLDDASFNIERSFFQRELKRIVEFCQTAENGPEALHALKEIRTRYNFLANPNT